MANKMINVLMSLKDEFSAPMKKVAENTKDADRQMRKANNTMNKFGKGVRDKIGGIASSIGTLATSFGAMGAGAYIVDSISTFKAFDQSMKNLSATAGIVADETSEDYVKMRDKARELGATTTKTASESADAMMYMKLAGWDTADVLANVDKVLMLSEASGMALASASDAVTDSMSALGIATRDTGKYLDVVAKAQQKSNMTAEMLMSAYKACGGALQALNIPLEESATALGVLANRGIKSAEAGNALSSIMTNLTSGTGQAGKAMKAIGLNAFDAQGKFKGLKNVLLELQQKTASMTQEQRTQTLAMIAGKEQAKTLNALMAGLNATTKDGTKEWDALSNELNKNANGSLEKMAKTMRNTLGGAMAGFRSALEDSQIQLVSHFEPALVNILNTMSSDVLPRFTNNMKWYGNEVLPEVWKWMDRLSPLFAGLIGYFVAFKIITEVVAMWQALVKVYEAVTIAQGVLNVVMSANPIGLMAMAIGALIGVCVLLWKNWDKVTESLKSAFDWFDKFTTWLTEVLKPILEPFIKMIDDFASGLSKISKVKLFGGGSSEEKPQHNATGTSFFKGGQSYVNENNRGELINLPSGSQIVPHDKVEQDRQSITINLNIQGNVIGNDDFINQCGQKITERLQFALGNI